MDESPSRDPRIRHRTITVGTAGTAGTAGGLRFHCAEAGDPAAPLVLLLHGFPECWATWRFQLPALAEAGFLAVAPDLRGYGGTDAPQGVRAYTTRALAGDVAALIEAYGRENAAVVGHDWGGYVAWHAAMWHPARLRRLAVLNIPHPQRMSRGIWAPAQLRRSWYVFLFQLPWLPERGIRRDGFASVQKLFRYMQARRGAYDEETIALTIEALSRPGALTAAVDYYRAALRHPTLRFEPVRCPALVIWGERDRWLRRELAVPEPRLVPDCTVERLPGAGHWPQADEPGQVNELLVRFLR